MTTIAIRARSIIAEHLGIDPSRVTPDALLDDLGTDPLDAIELAMAFEDVFGVTIPDEEWCQILTFGHAVNLIERLTAAALDRTPFGLADIRAFRAELVRRWPSCFRPAGKRKTPLKVGITRDLIAAGVPDSLLLRASLCDYTRGLTYLRSMVEGAERIALDRRVRPWVKLGNRGQHDRHYR